MKSQCPNAIVHVPRRFVADHWGGTETMILEVSRQQLRSGAKPQIMTSLALSNHRAEEIGGVPVRRFPYCYPFLGLSRSDRAAMDRKGGNLLSLSLFRSLLTQSNVRLFHTHALNRLGGEVCTAARVRRKPCVASIHGGFFDVPETERAEMRRPVESKPEWGKVFGALFGSRRLLERADHVICVGQNELEKAKAGLGHNRVSFVPNGVDYARFATGDGAAFRERYHIPSDAFVILNTGRLDAQKNQLLLLESFVAFQSRNRRAFLVLIGPETQPEYADRLRAFIDEYHLRDHVRLVPGLRHDSPDLVHAYHACDVFVLPSVHEPFGIVVLEAWSARKPVVVNHVGGLQTLVHHGKTGLCLDPESATPASDLQASLAALYISPALCRRLGERGSELARTQYDWCRIAQKLEEVYQAAEEHVGRRLGKRSL